MEAIAQFFDINNTFFTLLGYQISYLEFTGTLFNLVCVILAARRHLLTWPIGIVGVILFGVLFYQINLYADFFEQIFYLITGICGWYLWTRPDSKDDGGKTAKIKTNTAKVNLSWVAGIAVASIAFTYALTQIHVWLPTLFPEPASLPALDATTTVIAFAAQILMMQRKLESWILWIVVDIVAIGLYWYKEVPFVALLFALFLVNAIYAYGVWSKALKEGVDADDSKILKETL